MLVAVAGLDPVVGVLLDVMPYRRHQVVEDPGITRAASVTTSDGTTFNVASARV